MEVKISNFRTISCIISTMIVSLNQTDLFTCPNTDSTRKTLSILHRKETIYRSKTANVLSVGRQIWRQGKGKDLKCTFLVFMHHLLFRSFILITMGEGGWAEKGQDHLTTGCYVTWISQNLIRNIFLAHFNESWIQSSWELKERR